MIRQLLYFLALLPSRAFALAWNSKWDEYRFVIAGNGDGMGNSFLIVLANSWFFFVSRFVMGICIIAIVWGACMMQGVATDEGNRENGKKIIIGALIGLVCAVMAGPIVNFVKDFVNPTNFPVCGPGGGPGCP